MHFSRCFVSGGAGHSLPCSTCLFARAGLAQVVSYFVSYTWQVFITLTQEDRRYRAKPGYVFCTVCANELPHFDLHLCVRMNYPTLTCACACTSLNLCVYLPATSHSFAEQVSSCFPCNHTSHSHPYKHLQKHFFDEGLCTRGTRTALGCLT
jgi:hypothetical protein